MGDNLVPNGLSRGCKVFCSRSKYPTWLSLPTKISKTTPCKVTGGSLAWMLYPRKHFDMSGKSAAPFHHRAICKTAHGAAHRALGAMTGQKSRETVHLIH